MTQEDRELLLKDLCARFPYYVKLEIKYENDACKLYTIYPHGKLYAICKGGWPIESDVVDCKPYLFPLSSMTEEQKQEYQYITERWMHDSSYSIGDSIDWLNAHHFDYRGLIQMGLAIAVTKENNPYQ